MKKTISIFLASLFVISCASSNLKIKEFKNLEEAVADNATELDKEVLMPLGQKQKLAIMPVLTSEGETTVLGDRISELYYLYIFKQKKFQIIERKRIDSFLAEHSFENTGLVDPDQIKELGKILSVDYILVGTLRKNDNTISLTTRIIDIESAGLLTTAVTNIILTKAIDEQFKDNSNFAGAYDVEIQNVTINKNEVADGFSAPDIIVEFKSSKMTHQTEKFQDTYTAEAFEKFNISLVKDDVLKITILDQDLTKKEIIDEFIFNSGELRNLIKQSKSDYCEKSDKKVSIRFKLTKV